MKATNEASDRYTALGVAYPDPKTMCSGPCEGLGVYPERKGDDFEFVKCPKCNGTGKRQRK